MIAFAYSIGIELLPWQRWILVHALEILPSGRYRFRNVIVIVARQNGKTTLLKVLALWFMLHGGARMVLGTSTNLEYAREAWNGAVELAIEHDDPLHSGGATVQRGVGPLDDPLFGTPTRTAAAPWIKSVKYGALDTSMLLNNRARYKIATAGRRGGRSLSCDLVIADELREHKTWDAWGAASGTTTARPNPQIWGISNMGDQESIVLNHFIDAGESAIALGDTETDIGLFSYSAAPGADLTDRDAWRQANPSVGWIPGFTESTLEGKSKLPPTVFRPEHMCIPIDSGNPGFNGDAWRDSGDPNGTMDAYRSRVVCGVDVSPDLAHVSLIAVADTGDGRARCEPVAAWTSTEQARQELPDWIARVKPRAVVWFPTGPAAAIAPDLRRLPGSTELTAADVPGVCQGLAEFIDSRRLIHSGDPMLTAQVLGATKTPAGDGWRVVRRGAGHCDAVYALAGALHHVRTKLARHGKPRILTARV